MKNRKKTMNFTRNKPLHDIQKVKQRENERKINYRIEEIKKPKNGIRRKYNAVKFYVSKPDNTSTSHIEKAKS